MHYWIYFLFVFVEITLRPIQVITLHKSWWDTAWFIYSCRLSWFRGLCSCHCLPEHFLASLKVWLWLYSLPQRELLRVFSCQKLLVGPFFFVYGQTSWSSFKPRFGSTSMFDRVGFNWIESNRCGNNLLFYFFRWLKEERVCWTTCFFLDWLRLFLTRLLISRHRLWMFLIIFSSLELSLDSYLLLMSLSGYVVIKIKITKILSFSF